VQPLLEFQIVIIEKHMVCRAHRAEQPKAENDEKAVH